MLVGVIFIRRSLIIYLVGLQWVWSESYEMLAIIIERFTMTQMLYILAPWIGLGVLSILWIRALLRGRELERQLRECHQPLDDSGGKQAPGGAVLPEDIERYQRSQYFARIGTWDWEIDTEQLYWSDAIYPMFGFQVGEIVPSYERFCASVHPDDRDQVRA